MNRRQPVGPGVAISGMVRFGLSADTNNRWQSSFIPTKLQRQTGDLLGTAAPPTFATMIGRPWEPPATPERWKGRRMFRRVIRLLARIGFNAISSGAIRRSDRRLRASIRRPLKFRPSMIPSTMDRPRPRSSPTERCNRSASSGIFLILRRQPMI